MKQPTSEDLERLRALGLMVQGACRALAGMGDVPPGWPDPDKDGAGFCTKLRDLATSCCAACGKWTPFFAGLAGVEAMTLDLWFPPNGGSALSTTDIECTSAVEAMALVTAALAEAGDEDEATATLIQVVNRDALFVALQRALARAEHAADDPDANDGKPAAKQSAEARALGELAKDENRSDTEIAEAAGVNRTSLYRWKRYVIARETQRRDGAARRQGRHDGREAIDDRHPGAE